MPRASLSRGRGAGRARLADALGSCPGRAWGSVRFSQEVVAVTSSGPLGGQASSRQLPLLLVLLLSPNLTPWSLSRTWVACDSEGAVSLHPQPHGVTEATRSLRQPHCPLVAGQGGWRRLELRVARWGEAGTRPSWGWGFPGGHWPRSEPGGRLDRAPGGHVGSGMGGPRGHVRTVSWQCGCGASRCRREGRRGRSWVWAEEQEHRCPQIRRSAFLSQQLTGKPLTSEALILGPSEFKETLRRQGHRSVTTSSSA